MNRIVLSKKRCDEETPDDPVDLELDAEPVDAMEETDLDVAGDVAFLVVRESLDLEEACLLWRLLDRFLCSFLTTWCVQMVMTMP
jgi:hypothetical protein